VDIAAESDLADGALTGSRPAGILLHPTAVHLIRRRQQRCIMRCDDEKLVGDSTSNAEGMQVSVGGPVSMEELKHFFFSYAREDTEFVLRLAKELRAVGVKLWLDQLDIFGGQHWDRAVEGALETCEGMIIVLSPESSDSPNVMDEVAYALEKGKLIIPILLRSCDIPFRLRRLQYIDFTTGYDTGFLQLLRALHIDQPSQPLESEVPDDLRQTFLARRVNIGRKQQSILRFIETRAEKPDVSLGQEAISTRFKKDFPATEDSEIYYRLEQLRLLGFIVKEKTENPFSYRYRLSPAYRKELSL